jgi:hypothetical protein
MVVTATGAAAAILTAMPRGKGFFFPLVPAQVTLSLGAFGAVTSPFLVG